MSTQTMIFAYGSNLDPERMRERIPSTQIVGRARLPGHELRFHVRGLLDGTAKADAWRSGDPAHEVHGVIYRIDRPHLGDLDGIEGGYERRRHRLCLETGDRRGAALEAFAYHGQTEILDRDLLPSDWYVGHVARGARHHGLPASVIRHVEEHPVHPGSDSPVHPTRDLRRSCSF